MENSKNWSPLILRMLRLRNMDINYQIAFRNATPPQNLFQCQCKEKCNFQSIWLFIWKWRREWWLVIIFFWPWNALGLSSLRVVHKQPKGLIYWHCVLVYFSPKRPTIAHNYESASPWIHTPIHVQGRKDAISCPPAVHVHPPW